VTAHHRLAVETQQGSLSIQVDVALSAPWTVLFGPSGSGKSTLLRAAGGLLPNGVLFQRREPDGTWTELQSATKNIPSYRRQLSYSPQGAAVFPHIAVLQNAAFAAGDAANYVEEALDLFRLAPFSDQYPSHLSGGQLQLLALARAYAVSSPRLLLLDEPFTGIDIRLRDAILPRLQQRLRERNIPVLSVTHDVDEALLLEADVVRLDAGHIVAHAPVREALAEERHRLTHLLAR
jgi:molybdate transport system ATP-binding protein